MSAALNRKRCLVKVVNCSQIDVRVASEQEDFTSKISSLSVKFDNTMMLTLITVSRLIVYPYNSRNKQIIQLYSNYRFSETADFIVVAHDSFKPAEMWISNKWHCKSSYKI